MSPPSIRVADSLTAEVRAAWNDFAASPRVGHLHQCLWWAEPLARYGVRTRVLSCWKNGKLVGGALFRLIPLPLGGWTLAECLDGPIFCSWESSWAQPLAEAMRRLSREAGALAVSVKGCPRRDLHGDLLAAMKVQGFGTRLARGDTLALLDLSVGSFESIVRSFSYGARRNIKKARGHGVEVRALSDPNDLKKAHGAWLATAARKGFDDVRPWEALEPVLRACIDESRGFVLGSFLVADLLAAVFVSEIGDSANYVYGGYFDGADQQNPNHVLHMEAIRRARSDGAKSYNFGTLVRPEDPGHGLDRFKLSFNSVPQRQLDTIVWECRPFLYRSLEWLRRQRWGARLQSRLRRRMTGVGPD